MTIVASGHPDTIDLSEAARADAFLDEDGWFSARGLAEHGVTLEPARFHGTAGQLVRYKGERIGIITRPRSSKWFSAYNGIDAARGIITSESHGHRHIPEAAAFIAVRANIELVDGAAAGLSIEERRTLYYQHINSDINAALRHRIDPAVRERVRSALNGARALISLGQLGEARVRLANASGLCPPQHRAQRYIRRAAVMRRRPQTMRNWVIKAQRSLGFDEYGTVDLEADTPSEIAARATFNEQGRWTQLHPCATLRDPKATYGVLKLARQPEEGRPLEVVPDTYVINWGYWGKRSDKVIDLRVSESRRRSTARGARSVPRWVAFGLTYEDAYELMEDHGLAVSHAVLVHAELNDEAQLAARRLPDGRYLLVLDTGREAEAGVEAGGGVGGVGVWHCAIGEGVPKWSFYDDPLPQ